MILLIFIDNLHACSISCLRDSYYMFPGFALW